MTSLRCVSAVSILFKRGRRLCITPRGAVDFAPVKAKKREMPLVLGSASPRRAALLRELGMSFAVQASDIPETPGRGESAEAFAARMAREKGRAVAYQRRGDWVLSADTVVVVDGVIFGKPLDDDEARQMLARLSARAHEVLTAVALIAPDGSVAEELLVRSVVAFRSLSASEIDAYVASGEPTDKAGAYGIQGGASGFVRSVEGSYSNVVGLPVDEVRALLVRHELLSNLETA